MKLAVPVAESFFEQQGREDLLWRERKVTASHPHSLAVQSSLVVLLPQGSSGVISYSVWSSSWPLLLSKQQ